MGSDTTYQHLWRLALWVFVCQLMSSVARGISRVGKTDLVSGLGGDLTLKETPGDRLLLAQFAEMNTDWRYQDAKIENTIRLYVSIYALVISVFGGAAAFYSGPRETDLLFWLSLPVIPPLIFLGFFTARRVKNATISRDRRQLSINLIKLYFQQKDPGIEPYLPVYVSTPQPLQSKDDECKRHEERKQRVVSFPNGIIYFIITLNSALFGLFVYALCRSLDVAGIARRTAPELEIVLPVWVITVLASITFFLWQRSRYRRSKRGYKQKRK